MIATPLKPFLIQYRKRLRLREGLLKAQRTLWAAIAVSIGVLVFGRVTPIDNLIMWVFIPLISWLCATIRFALVQSNPLLSIAKRTDLELDLKERLSTAYEFEITAQKHSFSGNGINAELLPIGKELNLPNLQHDDAVRMAKTIAPRTSFPLQWQKWPILLSFGLMAAAAALIFLPNPMDAVLAERSAVQRIAQEQAEEIEEIKGKIEENDHISEAIRDDLLRQLEELSMSLRENPGNKEQALADLSKFEQELLNHIDPDFIQKDSALKTITAQLQLLTQREGRSPSTPMEALAQIPEMLTHMDNQDSRQDLAEALAQMAIQAAIAGDTNLAEALAGISQAALSGNSDSAAESANKAASAMEKSQREVEEAQVMQNILNQVGDSSQAIAQTSPSNQQTANQGVGNQGQNQGQRSASQGQNGQSMSGGGTKADSLPPSTGTGKTGIPKNVDTSTSTGILEEQLFIPWEIRDENGEEIRITGQDTGQGTDISRETQNPTGGLQGPALIPYQKVYTQYYETAQQAIIKAGIPSAYRNLVRDYFTQLQPPNP